MDQILCASLSHAHFWYEVDVLKVLAYVLMFGFVSPGRAGGSVGNLETFGRWDVSSNPSTFARTRIFPHKKKKKKKAQQVEDD